MEGGRFGVDAAYHGATGYQRAEDAASPREIDRAFRGAASRQWREDRFVMLLEARSRTR